MSVLKSKRTLSRYEYLAAYGELRKYSDEKVNKMAHRKFPYLGAPIIDILNHIENYLMQIFDQYFYYDIKLNAKPEQAKIVIAELQNLQKPLLALWNVDKYTENRMGMWCDLINNTIQHVARYGGIKCSCNDFVFILDKTVISKAFFIQNMCELHKLIYTKMVSAPKYVVHTSGQTLMDLANESLYYVCKANLGIPNNKQLYEQRKRYLSKALNCLKRMNRHIVTVFNLMGYSERVMNEWCELYTTELTSLENLIRADEKRFGHLT